MCILFQLWFRIVVRMQWAIMMFGIKDFQIVNYVEQLIHVMYGAKDQCFFYL